MPYGVAENVHTSSKCLALRNKSNPVVSLTDRKHLEVYVISSVVENSLSSVPKLIEFARNLSRDHKALSELKKNHTAASYKIVDELYFY